MNDIPNILIVDDKQQNLVALEKTLKGTNANFIKALNGDEALRASLKYDFALAILDVQMPGMDGYELAEYLREEERMRTLPIIFVSAVYMDEFHIFRGYEAGAVDYIVKPYEPSILVNKVKVFLELHRQKAELQKHREHLEELVSERTRDLNETLSELEEEITERKRAETALQQSEKELTIRNRIAEIFLTIADEQMYYEVLKIVLEVMESEFGIFGYIDEKGALVVPTMTRHIWDQCKVEEKDIVFPRETWGDSTWPQAIREKRTIYTNKLSKKTPEGHIAITRHISLPVIHRGEVLGLMLVANKETDYDERDIELFETIGKAIAPILDARLQRDREERERKKMEEKVKHLNLVLRAIRNVNQIIVRERDRDELLKSACKNFIETRGFQSAWIALVDGAGKVVTTARAGMDERFDALVTHMERSGIPESCGRAMERPGILGVEDTGTTCPDCPLSDTYGDNGALCIRLEHEGTVYGLLVTSLSRPFVTDPGEHSLLEEVAGDIAFALHNIDQMEEKKRADEALQESEAQLVERVKELNCLYTLSRLVETPGISLEEFLGQSVRLIPDGLQYPEIACARLVFVGREYTTDNYRDTAWKLTRDFVVAGCGVGSVDVCYLEERPEADDCPFLKQERNLIDGMARNISETLERKQAENALRESEAKYKWVSDNSPAVLYQYLMTPDGGFSFPYISDMVETIFGVTAEDVMNDPLKLLGMVHPDDQELFQKGIEIAAANLESFPLTFRCVKDEEILWIEARGMPTPLEDGGILWDGFLIDITERKKADEKLARLTARFRRVLATSPAVIYSIIADPKRKPEEGYPPMFISDNITKLFGYEVRECLEDPQWWAGHLHPRDAQQAFAGMSRVFEEGHYTHEYRFLHKDGIYRWVRDEMLLVYDDKGTPAELVGSWTDITNKKEHEQHHLNVIVNTSHLINTPLTVAAGHMDLVRMGLKEMTPELANTVHEKLQNIRDLVKEGLTKNITLLIEETSDGWTPVRKKRG